MERVVPCPNNKRLPATIQNVKIFNTKQMLSVYCEVELKENLTGSIQLEFTPAKCNDDLSSCSDFPTVHNNNLCNAFNSTSLGKNFFTRIEPRVKCPIMAGKYIFNNSLLEFEGAKRINYLAGRYRSKVVAVQTKNGKKRQLIKN
uniref:CSON002485 protein n=1 Tax=Culicoides sonorensis TaxID=179676 RepID=A0A336MWY2_CULSO